MVKGRAPARGGRRDTVAMIAGTVLIGFSGYLFLALIGHGRFDAATTAALSATYLIGNVLGPGIFVAAEQETSRVVSDAIARAVATATRVRRLAAVDSGLALLTALVLLLLTPLLLSKVLGEQIGLIAALLLAVFGSAAVYFVRGLTGGQRRFGRYAVTVVTDGATRIAGWLLLVAVGSTDPVLYALALCAGPAVAALLTFRRSGPPAGGAPSAAPAVSRLGRDVGLLLIASGLAMVMTNIAPVVVTAMIPQDPVSAAGFAGAAVLTRVPLLFMGVIQAMLLPGMTAAAAADDRVHLRSTTVRGLTVVAVIGVLAVLGTWLIGRPVLALLLGADRDTTDTADLVLLTVSAVIFMAVQLLQPALVALRRHRALAGAWIAGAVAFTAAFFVPIDPIDQGILAQLAGPSVTIAVQLFVLVGYLRRPPAAPGALPAPSRPSVSGS